MFLAGLDQTNAERRRLEAWERELDARERDIGSAPPGPGDDAPEPREQDGPGDEPAARS